MAYERTVWENGITPINAANLNNIEDGIVENKEEVQNLKEEVQNLNSEYIQVSISAMMSPVPTTLTKVPFDNLNSSNGESLIFSNNQIVIGDGVKAIKVSAHIKNNPLASGSHSFVAGVMLNGVSVQQIQSATDSLSVSISVPSIIIEVSKGDAIRIDVMATVANKARVNQAFLLVEKVV